VWTKLLRDPVTGVEEVDSAAVEEEATEVEVDVAVVDMEATTKVVAVVATTRIAVTKVVVVMEVVDIPAVAATILEVDNLVAMEETEDMNKEVLAVVEDGRLLA